MDKLSHDSSLAYDEYEEEIQNLKTQIKSMQFQISDLKNFIINQKNMHAKEIEQLRQTYQTSLQQTRVKHDQEIDALNSQIQQAKESCKNRQSGNLLELQNLLKESAKQLANNFQKKISAKLDAMFKQIIGCQQKFAVFNSKRMTIEYDRQIQILTLTKEVGEKNSLLERQKTFMDKILQQKKESDHMYEKQLSFLEEVYRQRMSMCFRLEKVNSELQSENSSIREHIVSRRRTEGHYHPTVYINLDEQEELVRRVVKTTSQVSQPPDRRTPKLQKKSAVKDDQDPSSGNASPLRSFKMNESRTLNSPPTKITRPQYSIAKSFSKSTANFGKKSSAKTIDVFGSNQFNISKQRATRDKQNYEHYV